MMLGDDNTYQNHGVEIISDYEHEDTEIEAEQVIKTDNEDGR
jgi:hypothetical protein